MPTFENYLVSNMDDYGVDTSNVNLISESGLSRVLNKIDDSDSFVIITAYRDEYDKKDNINRNRKMRSEFNNLKMGVYQVVGHWQECSDQNIEYKDCPKNKLTDVIERSYISVKPTNMEQKEFEILIKSLLQKFDQDAGIIKKDGMVYIIYKNGSLEKIGTSLSLNKISQAYSQFVKKMNIPFVFEGVELPATNMGRMIMSRCGIKYPIGHFHDLRNWSDLIREV